MGEFVDLDICLDIVMHTRCIGLNLLKTRRDLSTESGGRHHVVSPNQRRSFFLENLADDSRRET